jgi:peptidyl-prolyl cis-trans isomerase-like 3
MSVTFHTTAGEVKVELFCDTAPRTCFNFLALAASGAYDNTVFHRNMKAFMVQGGDPTGTGKGGQSIWGAGQPFDLEISPTNKHNARGTLSMVSNGPNSTRSQFFFAYGPQAHLDNVYTVFGHAIDHLETLDVIERAPTGAKNRPTSDIILESITIHANPLADSDIVYPSAHGPPR